MATIAKLKPGQILYDVHRTKMGNTTVSRLGCWPVEVVEVDPEGRWIVAKWNYNRPRKMYRSQVAKLKVRKPEKLF